MSEVANIAGQWEGLYAYGGHQQHMPPVSFQASFAVPNGESRFEGSITDAGDIGEATVYGAITGRNIRFVKRYLWTRYGKARPIQYVRYEGVLSEDGLYLTGAWHIQSKMLGFIPLRAEGVWRAQRPGLPEPPLTWPPPPQMGQSSLP